METNDNALVFTLPEALIEIRDLRAQKAEMVKALKYVAGSVGGSVGERAALALMRIDGTHPWCHCDGGTRVCPEAACASRLPR